jgi:putative SOS response-associated peptidase YedK
MEPGQMVSVFARDRAGQHVLKEMKWGLVPTSYAAFPEDWSGHTSHARIETVHELAAFRDSWRLKRRVIFPMDHFRQRARDVSKILNLRKKQAAVDITRADGAPLGIAGLYNAFQTAEGLYLSCAMLTRPASRGLEGINDRFPAMIEPKDFTAWLDGADHLDLETPPAAEAFAIALAA